jgi:CheY-like chemotaxis protein
VEDEDPVRNLLVRLLKRRGYHVTEATTVGAGKSAIDAQPFALVLCDVRLSDGNGAECVRYLRRVRPEAARRVIFVTGDAAALTGTVDEFVDIPLLPKPFTIADLDRVLATMAGDLTPRR